MTDIKIPVREPRLGTTLYALTNEFLSRRFSFEALISEVAKRNIGPGLEIVGFQSIRGFPDITDAFAERFKELVAIHKLVPTSLAINADQEIRRGQIMTVEESVAYHEPQLKAAAKLGFPIVRYQYGAGPEVIRRLVPLAEKLNVKMGLEIHAPQHANHPVVLGLREMYAREQSPYLGWIPDFSSTARTVPPGYLNYFRAKGVPEGLITLAMEIWSGEGDAQARMALFKRRASDSGYQDAHFNEMSLIFPMYGKADPESWLELMPDVIHVHGKFWSFDANGDEEAIDYDTILPMFRDAGYDGYISSEWEGHVFTNEDAFPLIEAHQAMCRRIWQEAPASIVSRKAV